tara:strand:- start:12 stop:353 length:342 start_codon:yes stop_codon:yes gene_type:complete
MTEINRPELTQHLNAWINGSLSAEEVWRWALEARSEREPGDVAVRDIIDMLCSIPEDLLLPVDAEVMLDALNNPEDEADLSANLLWNYADMIDVSGRKKELADDPLYAPYCGT